MMWPAMLCRASWINSPVQYSNWRQSPNLGTFHTHSVCAAACHGDAGYWNGSQVAVKVLEQVAGDFNPRSSLEPLLHHRLSHPNIVAMFDVCTQVSTWILRLFAPCQMCCFASTAPPWVWGYAVAVDTLQAVVAEVEEYWSRPWRVVVSVWNRALPALQAFRAVCCLQRHAHAGNCVYAALMLPSALVVAN
jgi:hypothetical protein